MQTSGLPTRMPVPFADSGAKNVIPVPSQIPFTPGLASFTDGFPPATRTPIAAGGVPPYGLDFNGILNAITTAVRWSNAGGRYAFDAAFSSGIGGYPKGALIARSGYDGYWQNVVENNTANPDTGGAGWVPFNGQGSDYGIDAGSINSYAVAYSPAVVTLTDGMVLKFKAGTSNSGPSVFTANSLPAKTLLGPSLQALQGGEIVANGDVWIQWNSSIGTGSWVVINSSGGGSTASQIDALAGTSNVKWMSPLRVAQAIANVFVQATEAVLGVAKVATQALTNAGTDDTTFITPKKLRFGVIYSFGINGYVSLPQWAGGWTLQWGGQSSIPTGSALTVTFPIAFPSGARAVMATGANNNAVSINAFTATSTTVQLQANATTGGPYSGTWLAIGN